MTPQTAARASLPEACSTSMSEAEDRRTSSPALAQRWPCGEYTLASVTSLSSLIDRGSSVWYHTGVENPHKEDNDAGSKWCASDGPQHSPPTGCVNDSEGFSKGDDKATPLKPPCPALGASHGTQHSPTMGSADSDGKQRLLCLPFVLRLTPVFWISCGLFKR